MYKFVIPMSTPQIRIFWRKEGKPDREVTIRKDVKTPTPEAICVSYKNKAGEEQFQIVPQSQLFSQEIKDSKHSSKNKSKQPSSKEKSKITNPEELLNSIFANNGDILYVVPTKTGSDQVTPIQIKPHSRSYPTNIEFLRQEPTNKVTWRITNIGTEKTLIDKPFDRLEPQEQQLFLVWMEQNIENVDLI